MQQYVVYKHKSRKDLLLLVVQSDVLSSLASRLVAPLIKKSDFGMPASRLIEIEGEVYVMDTANLAALSGDRLGGRVDSLASSSVEILNEIQATPGFCASSRDARRND